MEGVLARDTVPVEGLSHVVVPCGSETGNVEAVANFYCGVFGFMRMHRPSSGTETEHAWLHSFASGLTLHLVADTGVAAACIPLVTGDLEVARVNLEARRLTFDTTGTAEAPELRLRDPAGNTVVIRTATVFPVAPSSQESLAGLVAPPAEPTQARRGIAVLTSGGDAQGMNAALRAVVRTAILRGCEVFAVHEGYHGLVVGGDLIRRLEWNDVSGIIARGGTIIGTARSKEFRTREGRLQAVHNMVTRGIDALVVMGGDGSLTGANIFRSEWSELLKSLVADGRLSEEQAARHPLLNVAGLVGSIDNDMCGTDMTIGADSALHRALTALDALSSTAASHQRAFVVEVMGRNCGWLALYAALASGADWLFIPEAPSMADDWAEEMCATLRKHKLHGKRRICVVVCEGAVDKNNKRILSEDVRKAIETTLNIETRVTVLGHVQRGGKATFFDRYMATIQGVEAVNALLDMGPTDPSPMIGISENNITRTPLMEAVERTQAVAKALAAREFDTAVTLRGGDFRDALNTFNATALGEPANCAPACGHSLRIAIIHTGAPSGGMNAATRVLVRLCIARGHSVVGVRNGFKGLANGEMEELNWMSVDGWSDRGGSELGTNRHVPREDLGMVAFQMQQHHIDGICVLGGFEALLAVNALVEARARYPQFCVPIVHLPATISNNVPGTDFSLGSDTALNVIVECCDLLRQSASSSTRRAFVVEVMGGRCGYLATMAGLAGGATRVYVPEEGITYETLSRDVEMLRRKFAHGGKMGRVLLRNEHVSNTYTTEFVASLLNEEGSRDGLFDCRTANPGHLQQGGAPSALDRVRGARLAAKCAEFLESQALQGLVTLPSDSGRRVNTTSHESACVIGFRGAHVALTPIRDAMADADLQERRPKSQWWRKMLPLLRMLTDAQ